MKVLLEKERKKALRKSTPEWSIERKKEKKRRKCIVFSVSGGGLKLSPWKFLLEEDSIFFFFFFFGRLSGIYRSLVLYCFLLQEEQNKRFIPSKQWMLIICQAPCQG